MPSVIQPSSRHNFGPEDTLLRKFDVSKNGFLPSTAPLSRLANPYYAPWENLILHLPSLLKKQALRDAVKHIDVLSTAQLVSENEWRRAYVVLAFLTHGYIWGGDNPAEVLPPAIAVPLLQVSEHFDLPPVATYAALNLWNFASLTNDFSNLDGLQALHTFTGTEDESWFYTLSVAMEAQGAHIISPMLRAIEAVERRDYGTMMKGMEEMILCIEKLGQLLERMYEKCDPMVFYHQIRPFLAGSKNMAAAGLPRGVFYDEGNGKGSWRELRGGSNGQSSLIQFLDVVLGIEHNSAGNKPLAGPELNLTRDKTIAFHEEVRSYMPGPHRRFLRQVSRSGSLRDFVSTPSSEPEHEQLQLAYQATTTALSNFRNKHLQIVTRYIVIPSRTQTQAQAVGSTVNLATASSQSEKRADAELTGTGGTSLIPFLKQTRDETFMAGCSIRQTQ